MLKNGQTYFKNLAVYRITYSALRQVIILHNLANRVTFAFSMDI